MPASIDIKTAAGDIRTISLQDDRYLLGRDAGCQLSFPDDAGLSRQHLMFVREGTGWVVEDLNSRNGSFLNGARFTGRKVLGRGDIVKAGKLQIRYAESGRSSVTFEAPATADALRATIVVNLKDLVAGEMPRTGAAPKPAQWTSPAQALLRAGRELVAGQPLPELFPVILRLAMEASGAERGVLMTLENGVLVEQAKSDGEFRISSLVRDKVIQDKESLLIVDALGDAQLQHRQSIVLQNITSLMAVPLQTEDRVIGLIYVDSRSALRPFVQDDLNLLTVMANIAAMRIERQRLAQVEKAEEFHRMELEQAAEIQRRSLPDRAPAVTGYFLDARSVPCLTVGGDYYDFFTLRDGRTMVAIGDVAGKGMPAALLVMSAQANAAALASYASDLGDFVARLNNAICPRCPEDRFITFFVCALDAATGELTYCNAGHNPPLILRADGAVERVPPGGLVLGIFPDVPYREGRTVLEKGDSLLLYTDGITEAENTVGGEFEMERLEAAAQELRGVAAGEELNFLFRRVAEFAEGAPASDDRTLVLIRRN